MYDVLFGVGSRHISDIIRRLYSDKIKYCKTNKTVFLSKLRHIIQNSLELAVNSGGMWWCGHKRIDAWHQDTRNICSG